MSECDNVSEDVRALICGLAHEETSERYRAIRALRIMAAALKPLAIQANAERDAVLRAAIFDSIAAIGSADAALRLVGFLRSDHPAIRGQAIASLQRMGDAACKAVDRLLQDEDANLLLLGVDVMRAWRPELAAPRLAWVIGEDEQVSVCSAALDVAAQTSTLTLLPALERLLIRFGELGFIEFAVEQSRLRMGGVGGDIYDFAGPEPYLGRGVMFILTVFQCLGWHDEYSRTRN